MTFSYDGTKPNPNDDPADDVSQMQTNAASIGSIIPVDHVGFNLSGGGLHKQVTYNGNNIPAIGGGGTYLNSFLFTNKASPAPAINLDQLFYYPNGATAAQSSGQYVPSATGSTMLLGGIILKWGVVNNPTNNQVIAFSSPFPNNLFTINLTGARTNSASLATLYVNDSVAPTVAQFVLSVVSASGAFNKLYWTAIGN